MSAHLLISALMLVALSSSALGQVRRQPHSDDSNLECECRQFDSTRRLMQLSDQVIAVGANAFNPQINTNFPALRAQLLEQVPARCRQFVFERTPIPDVSLNVGFAGASINPLPSSDVDFPIISRRIRNTVQSTFNQYVYYEQRRRNCIPPDNLSSSSQDDSAARAFYACMEGIGPGMFAGYAEYVRSQPDPLLALDLQNGSDPELLRLVRAYVDILTSGENWRAALHRHDDLSIDQRLAVVGAFMSRLGNADYNDRRSDMGALGVGAVSVDQVLNATVHNTAISYNGQGFRPDSTFNGGVCRDAAVLAASFLSEWGFPRTFVLAGPIRTGEWHVWVTAGDPRNLNSTYTLNWTDIRRIPNTAAMGSQAVEIPESSGVRQRVYFSNGSPATTLELPRGLAQRQMMGLQPVDPLDRLPQPIAQGSVSLNRNGTTQLRPGLVRDSTGAWHFGVALTHDYGQSTYAPGRVGVLVEGEVQPNPSPEATAGNFDTLVWGASGRPIPTPMSAQGASGASAAQSNPQEGFTPISLASVFAYMEQHFNTPDLVLFRGALRARIETLATAAFNAGVAIGNDGGTVSFDGDVRTQVGLRIEQGNRWSDRFTSTLRAIAQVEPNFSNVANVNLAQMPIPLLHHLLFEAEGRARLMSTPEGAAFLVGTVRAVLDYIGPRGQAALGLNVGPVAVSAFIQGRLTDDVPLWMPGAARTVGGTVQVRPARGQVQGSLSVQRSIEPGADPIPTVQGNLSWVWEPQSQRPMPRRSRRNRTE